jgi:VCBS repeat-containing protein
LILNSNGTFTYTPNPDFNGTDTFIYEVTDGNGGTTQVTVMIDVTPVNDAPTFFGPSPSITLDEDVPYTAMLGVNDLLINSVDIDGDTLTVSSTPVSGPSNGVLILNGNGTLTYTPNSDFNGTDAFTYEITDGNGGLAQALVTITVNPINDAPVTGNVVLNEQANTSALIDGGILLANDTDVDGDTLSLVSLTQPSNGFVSLNPDGTIVYIPTAGFVGVDTFTYTVSDPSGAQAIGLVVIDVTAEDESAPDVVTANGGDEDEIVPSPLDESTGTEEEPETANSASAGSAPTVSLLVTPDDSEFNSADLPQWQWGEADLVLIVGGEVDTTSAEILSSQAQARYTQVLNSAAGNSLGGFEFASLDPASLARALDAMGRGLDGLENANGVDGMFLLQISTGMGAVLSVGVVSWILRGGALAATLLSTVPMWKGFDPLPMLMGRRKKKDDEDDEEERDNSDDEEIVSDLDRTTELRELHLERMFSESGRFKAEGLTGRKPK